MATIQKTREVNLSRMHWLMYPKVGGKYQERIVPTDFQVISVLLRQVFYTYTQPNSYTGNSRICLGTCELAGWFKDRHCKRSYVSEQFDEVDEWYRKTPEQRREVFLFFLIFLVLFLILSIEWLIFCLSFYLFISFYYIIFLLFFYLSEERHHYFSDYI